MSSDGDGGPVVPPSREDPVVAGASTLVGGPWGRHAVGLSAWWWTPLRVVLLLTVLTTVLGYLAKAPCRTHAWTDEYQYTRICYTDVYALYFAEHLGSKVVGNGDDARISVPYRDHPVEYPAVIGGLMWSASEVTNLVHPDDPRVTSAGVQLDGRPSTFFDITALLLACFALATTWAVAKLAGRPRVWDAAMFALAPGLLLHAYTNWDLAAVALAMLGMWAWSRPWRNHLGPVVGGALIGVGTATKLYPVLFLVVLFFLCWRAARMVEWVIATGAATAAFAVAYAPAWLLSRPFAFPDRQCAQAHSLSGWRWFWDLNRTRGADWDSLWLQLEHLRGRPLDSTACGQSPMWLNLGVALGTVVVVGLVALLIFAAGRRPRLPQVAFLLVAGFLLVNKVDSPQYVLWLIPLAVLARPRWPAFLLWQAAEALLLVARFYFFVGNDAANAGRSPEGIPIWMFFGTVIVRDLTLLLLMGLVVREIVRPEHDVVRADGADDPAGGVLDGAPDRWSDERMPVAQPAPA